MSDTPSRQHFPGGERNKNRLKPLTARSLAIGGFALMAASLNSLVFAILPLQLASPEWLLRVISALLTSSLQLLVGTLILIVLVEVRRFRFTSLKYFDYNICYSVLYG
jgi:hypothetical protein